MRFPQTFIDDLRRQADIVRIVQDYVTLKKTGANWVARCPFHKETKPSFSVNPAKEIFYCFGCQKGASQEQLERSGLVVKKDEGGSYDRFRGRLIFPVFDAQGKPIAFGGRTLDPEAEPKYLNSPETSAYTKGRHLYGLHQTRDEIRRQGFAILVEGYLDLIVPYQFGVRNVVASLGTALTPEQVKLIARFARKVVVNYDGDRAGVQAAKRAIETILTEDIEVKVLVLPDNADPDDFIRKYGVTEYQQRRSKAQPHIQFVIDQAVRDRNLYNPADKATAVEETLPFVRAVRGRIQRREYFDIAMDALRIQADQRRELWQRTRGAASPDPAGIRHIIVQPLKATVAEEKLLELVLGSEELRKIVLPRLEPSDYEGVATAPIFRALVKLNEEESEVSFDSLSAETADDPSSSEFLARLMIAEAIENFDEAMAQANSCLNALRLMKLDRQIDELSAEVGEAERAGEAEKRDKLSMQLLELSKRRSSFLPAAQVSKSVH